MHRAGARGEGNPGQIDSPEVDMARKHSILRGLGLLFVFILVVFTGAFFYAYITGGDAKVLLMFAGDGIGVLQIEGAIDDPRNVFSRDKLQRVPGTLILVAERALWAHLASAGPALLGPFSAFIFQPAAAAGTPLTGTSW